MYISSEFNQESIPIHNRLKEKKEQNENLGIFLLKKTKTTIVKIIKHLRKQLKKARWKNSPMVILWDKNIVKLPYCKKIYRF